MEMLPPPPGWYPDAEQPGWTRWWDGQGWTGYRMPAQPVIGQPAASLDPYDVPNGRARVGFLRAVDLAFRQYARFSGRASRSECWWWFLFVWIVGIATAVPGWIHTARRTDELERLCTSGRSGSACTEDPTSLLFVLTMLWMLVILLPTIAVAVRRLHDTGKSGAYYLFVFVPWVGSLVVLVLLVLDPTPGPNQYGWPPAKGEPAVAGGNLAGPQPYG